VPTHLALGASAGLTDDELAWLNHWDEAPPEVFNETDRLVLRYADTLTRTVTVDDALWEALAARFSTTEIFELCFTVGLANLINRVHATFLTDVDTRTLERVERLGLPESNLPEPRY
jgi:alkylhydroperoxidase family enzyme